MMKRARSFQIFGRCYLPALFCVGIVLIASAKATYGQGTSFEFGQFAQTQSQPAPTPQQPVPPPRQPVQAPRPATPPPSPTPATPQPPPPTPAPQPMPEFEDPLALTPFGEQIAFASLASVPSMIGDFFGSTASGGVSILYGTTPIDSSFENNNLFQGNGGNYFVPDNTGQPLDLTPFGIDTNGDNVLDYFPGLTKDPGTNNTSTRYAAMLLEGEGAPISFRYEDFAIYQGMAFKLPSPGAMIGRVKIAENGSPLPRNRVFMNYSYFNSVALGNGTQDVNRMTPGFEKTFFNGWGSIEARFPFATTLDSDVFSDQVTNTSELEFGNVTLYAKALLKARSDFALGAGLGISLPTADDVNVRTSNGLNVAHIDNKAVYLMPYLGAVYLPTERFFLQGFLEFLFDTNGNPVSISQITPFSGLNGNLASAGRLNDANLAFLDIGGGYWLFRDTTNTRFFRGFAPTFEVHYNHSINETDSVVGAGGAVRVGQAGANIDVLNLTVGANMLLGDRSTLTTAYVVPVGGGSQQQFDGELRVMFNWYFGGSEPAAQYPTFP